MSARSGSLPAGDPAAPARWRVFPALALGSVMATLDISVVNIALPTLSRTFGVPLTSIEWVVLAYVLTITGLLLVLGRVADVVGRRRVYGLGLIVFTIASGLCAAAPSGEWLIAARALQGLGAGMMTANSAALLIANFPETERGKALGAFGAMVGVGLALGPPLGGLLVHWSWRWIFVINLPLGVLALWRLAGGVPPDHVVPHRVRLDLWSAAMWSAALVLLTLGLSRGPAEGWGSIGVWPLFAGAAALGFAFVLAEQGSAEPLLPVRRLRGPLGNAALLTMSGQMLSIVVGFHLPHYLEQVLHFDPARSGRYLAVLPLMALVSAPVAGRLADRLGPRPVATAGLAIAAVGFWLFTGLGITLSPGRLHGAMALIGVGLGLFSVPNASAVMSAVPREQLGLASGLQATMRNLGIAGGAAGMAALVASRYAAHGGNLAAARGEAFSPLAFTLASRDAYGAVLALALASVALSWPRRAQAGATEPGSEPAPAEAGRSG